MLVVISTTNPISIRLVISTIHGWHPTLHIRQHRQRTTPSRPAKRLLLLILVSLLGPFLHVSVPFLLRGRSWNLLIEYKGLLKLFNLLVIFDNLTLDLRHDVLATLWNDVLLLRLLGWVVDGRRLLICIERGPWDLGSALHLRGQITIDLSELVLDLLLLFLGDWPTNVVIVNVLLSRVDHRVCVLDTGRL